MLRLGGGERQGLWLQGLDSQGQGGGQSPQYPPGDQGCHLPSRLSQPTCTHPTPDVLYPSIEREMNPAYT